MLCSLLLLTPLLVAKVSDDEFITNLLPLGQGVACVSTSARETVLRALRPQRPGSIAQTTSDVLRLQGEYRAIALSSGDISLEPPSVQVDQQFTVRPTPNLPVRPQTQLSGKESFTTLVGENMYVFSNGEYSRPIPISSDTIATQVKGGFALTRFRKGQPIEIERWSKEGIRSKSGDAVKLDGTFRSPFPFMSGTRVGDEHVAFLVASDKAPSGIVPVRVSAPKGKEEAFTFSLFLLVALNLETAQGSVFAAFSVSVANDARHRISRNRMLVVGSYLYIAFDQEVWGVSIGSLH